MAAALGEKGKKILVVDLDPQASASTWLGTREEEKGLLEVFTDNAPIMPLIRETPAPGVDLIPASPWLVGLDRYLAGEPGAETILRGKLGELPGRWDFCLLDCPPSLGLLSLSALVAVDKVMVPVEASTMALAGLVDLANTMERVKGRLNPELDLGAILICRAVTRTRLCQEIITNLRERFGPLVFNTVIRETVRLREAWGHGEPITSYATRSPGAEDYRAAAVEFLKRKGKK